MGINLLQNPWHIRFLHKTEMRHNNPDICSQVGYVIPVVRLNDRQALLLIDGEQKEIFATVPCRFR